MSVVFESEDRAPGLIESTDQVIAQSTHIGDDEALITVRREVKDRVRGQAVIEGYKEMAAAQPPPDDGFQFTDPAIEHARRSIRGNLEGMTRCMSSAGYKEYEHRNHGYSYRPDSHIPCGEPGHEQCGWWDAMRDLRRWTESFAAHYPIAESVVVLELTSSLGFVEVRAAVTKLKNRKASSLLLGRTVGVLMPREGGYSYFVAVKFEQLASISTVAVLWEELAGVGATVKIRTVASTASACEVTAELVCRARQALPLLVHQGRITAWQALQWRAEELESHGNHLVFGRGFKNVEGGQHEGTTAAFDGAYYEAAEEQRAEALRSFSDIQEGAISENVASAPEATTPQGPESVVGQWQPCSVCDDPTCGERPTGRVLPWRLVMRLVKIGKAVERDDGTVVATGTVTQGLAA